MGGSASGGCGRPGLLAGTGRAEAEAGTNAGDQLQRLKGALEFHYPALARRLSRTLRSRERALEALHEAYVKLSGGPAIGEVRNPLHYLYRMTINLARNASAKDERSRAAGPDMIDRLVDEAPGPERTAIAVHDLGKLLDALASLPNQRRVIFLARWRDNQSATEIAGHMGLHRRTVQKELAKAARYLIDQMRIDD